MHPKETIFGAFAAVLFFLCLASQVIGQVGLQYQKRENRHEGIKFKPVSGADIELVSALVDYIEDAQRTPDFLRIKFYLEKPSSVHLTVRELDYKRYYWMDKVEPAKPWNTGFANVFAWPTGEVIQQLDGMDMYDLGIVARLQKPEPGKIEQVAPAILFHKQSPPTVEGYLFTFKTNGDANLTASVYRDQQIEPVFTQAFRRLRGGRPFTVQWKAAQSVEGSYKLVLSGYFLRTNDPIDQMVRFYHQPHVQ